MLGDTLVVTVSGVAKTLSKINQDTYSAEYLLRSSTDEIRARVRHSKEKAVSGETYQVERHAFTITQTVFATTTTPTRFRECNFTIRSRPDDDSAAIVALAVAATGYLTSTNLGKINGWES